MSRTIVWFCFLGLLLITSSLGAQSATDSSLLLPEIEVLAPNLREVPIGSVSKEWNSATAQQMGFQSIADLLQLDQTTFVKSYGSGSLATSSVRGGSAGHTLVLWNGFPIHSPMLGLLDLSLLPINAAENIKLQKGGAAALWGSGAIGGVLSLNNKPGWEKGWQTTLGSQAGSFGHWQHRLQVQAGSENFQSVTKVLHEHAQNDFRYEPAPGLEAVPLDNAKLSKQNIQQDFYLRLPRKNAAPDQIKLHLWWQQANRQIPPTLTQTRSEAYQYDQSTRINLSWQRYFAKATTTMRAAWYDEDLDYFDPQTKLEALSNFRSWLAESHTQWQWSQRQDFQIGLSHFYTVAKADGYAVAASENRSALFATHRVRFDRLQWQLSLRQALIDQQWAPLLPMFGVSMDVTPTIQLRGKLSR
ncbi:MAG: TonB-dependent receptor plug domain-containing protein, partial [Bacteroidota bacterium]